MKAFKKESFKEKFNYDFIFSSISDALAQILYSPDRHSITDGQGFEITIYPRSVYKNRKEVDSDDDDNIEELNDITRF